MRVNMAKQWLRQGCQVEFVLLEARGELLASLPSDATIACLGAKRLRQSVVPLVRYLQSARPNALLVAMWPLTAIAIVAARLAHFRGRIVISDHNHLSTANLAKGRLYMAGLGLSMRLAYPMADTRIAVSNGVAEDLSRLSGLRRELFNVIYNPAAISEDVDLARVPSVVTASERPLILSVGTLKKQKRHDLLIDAFARLPTELKGTLCILGEGTEREALVAQVAALGLSEKVLLPGFVLDTGPWYKYADLFVLSSDYEGFGNVIVEAMAQGTPVVSTNCPSGPSEILEDGRFGRLVPVRDVDALTRAMSDALQSSHDSAKLKRRAQDFSVDRVAKQYLDLLLPQRRELIGDTSGESGEAGRVDCIGG